MRRLAGWLEQMDRQELLATPLAFSFAVSPADIESGRVQLTPKCPHLTHHGARCITCGMTRAFAAIGHGRLQTALRYNRGALPLYGAFIILTVASGLGLTAVCGRLAPRRSARYASRGRRWRAMRTTAIHSSQPPTAAAHPETGTHTYAGQPHGPASTQCSARTAATAASAPIAADATRLVTAEATTSQAARRASSAATLETTAARTAVGSLAKRPHALSPDTTA
jgi:hypothetical protein